ncbi:SdpI family protein [Candidatus Uhrbacteria bacterium]|nr:SdpI family protein [Candidatus Uhrbacteria bacterium]
MTNKILKTIGIQGWVRICIVAAMFVVGLVLYPYLPEMVPTHWGIEGEPNAWGPKIWGAWIIPLMSLAFLILFPLLPKLDPKRENYEHFKKSWGTIQTALVGILGYMYAVTMYVTFYPQYNSYVGKAVTFGIGVLFVILGNVMGKVRQNYFVGLKTPWTLNDPEVWQKSQRFSGWMFVLAGLAFIIESIVWIAIVPVFIMTISLTVVAPIVYSYLLSRKKK